MSEVQRMSIFGEKKKESTSSSSSDRKLNNAVGISDICDRVFIFSDLLEYAVTHYFQSPTLYKMVWKHLYDVTSNKEHRDIYKRLSIGNTFRLFYQLRCLSHAEDNLLADKNGFSHFQDIKIAVENKLCEKGLRSYKVAIGLFAESDVKEFECLDDICDLKIGCFFPVMYDRDKNIITFQQDDGRSITNPLYFFDGLIPKFLESIDNVISVSEYIILCYYLSMNHALHNGYLQQLFFTKGALNKNKISYNYVKSQDMRYLMENDQDSAENYVRFDKYIKLLDDFFKISLSQKHIFGILSDLVLLNALLMCRYFGTDESGAQLTIARHLHMTTDFLTQEDLKITPSGRKFDYRPISQFM